jgi:hypothetical protein
MVTSGRNCLQGALLMGVPANSLGRPRLWLLLQLVCPLLRCLCVRGCSRRGRSSWTWLHLSCTVNLLLLLLRRCVCCHWLRIAC